MKNTNRKLENTQSGLSFCCTRLIRLQKDSQSATQPMAWDVSELSRLYTLGQGAQIPGRAA
jgi:hypothetical protein